MNYDSHQAEAVLRTCTACGRQHYATEVHGPREKCLDCQPWKFGPMGRWETERPQALDLPDSVYSAASHGPKPSIDLSDNPLIFGP
jgi:hypothetical protein